VFAGRGRGYEAGVNDETVERVVAAAAAALERRDVPYVLIGGIASSVHGRPRATDDIDVLVDPRDADRALETLGAAGFETEATDPHWIYKATMDGQTVDVMFNIKGDVHVDEEMLARARPTTFAGHEVRVAAPEDVIVIKALAHDEPSFRHWHDALAIITAQELDWDYLVRRARHGVHRVLSLLVYAQSNDLIVPEQPIRILFESIYDADGADGISTRSRSPIGR
jgi:predicted nucleotidyltransferase